MSLQEETRKLKRLQRRLIGHTCSLPLFTCAGQQVQCPIFHLQRGASECSEPSRMHLCYDGHMGADLSLILVTVCDTRTVLAEPLRQNSYLINKPVGESLYSHSLNTIYFSVCLSVYLYLSLLSLTVSFPPFFIVVIHFYQHTFGLHCSDSWECKNVTAQQDHIAPSPAEVVFNRCA